MDDSVFETTIRYVGALLSAYELSNKTYPALVTQAQTLADRLAFAWSRVSAYMHARVDSETDRRT